MKLITINKTVHDARKQNQFEIEEWLYDGGIKKFISNINKMNIDYFIINVVEIGDVNEEELDLMIEDGYKFMDSTIDDFDTLYR